MNEKIDDTLKGISARFSDRRTQLLDVKPVSFDNRHLQLEGRVLDESTLQTLIYCLARKASGIPARDQRRPRFANAISLYGLC